MLTSRTRLVTPLSCWQLWLPLTLTVTFKPSCSCTAPETSTPKPARCAPFWSLSVPQHVSVGVLYWWGCVCCRRGRRRWCWRSVMAEGTWWELCCPVELRWTCVTMTAPQRSCVPVNTDTWTLCGSCCLCRAVTPRSLIMWVSLHCQAWFHLHLLNSVYLFQSFSLSIFASVSL